MAKIVESALEPYFDKEKVKIVREENSRMYTDASDLVKTMLEQPLNDAFANIDIEGLAKGLDLKEVIDPKFVPPEPGKEVKETRDWVYDSNINYWDQLQLYKKYKSDRVEEET
jgi:hypothetical protein